VVPPTILKKKNKERLLPLDTQQCFFVPTTNFVIFKNKKNWNFLEFVFPSVN
jgi:hypothetical protein